MSEMIKVIGICHTCFVQTSVLMSPLSRDFSALKTCERCSRLNDTEKALFHTIKRSFHEYEPLLQYFVDGPLKTRLTEELRHE